jgi:hypothetical protein
MDGTALRRIGADFQDEFRHLPRLGSRDRIPSSARKRRTRSEGDSATIVSPQFGPRTTTAPQIRLAVGSVLVVMADILDMDPFAAVVICSSSP